MATLLALLLLVGVAAAFTDTQEVPRQRRQAVSSATVISSGGRSYASTSTNVGSSGTATADVGVGTGPLPGMPGFDGGFYYPSGPFNPSNFEAMFRSYFDQLQQNIMQQQALANRFHEQLSSLGNSLEANGGYEGAGADYGASSGAGTNYAAPGMGGAAEGAQASLAVSGRGGFGQASLYPDPAQASRVSGAIDPLSGQGYHGVFSSASSSSSDINGRRTSSKQATVGVNNNGKITTFSAKDP